MSNCLICNVHEEVLHGHHTIPQAYGGKNSKIVDLCATCHNLVHAHANAILSYQRSGGKRKIKQFWTTTEKEQKALPLVHLIVEAATNHIADKTYKMISEFDSATYSKLRFIKKDLGLASLDEALNYCINFTHAKASTVNNTYNTNTVGNHEKKRISVW